jgi:hypothetical protein
MQCRLRQHYSNVAVGTRFAMVWQIRHARPRNRGDKKANGVAFGISIAMVLALALVFASGCSNREVVDSSSSHFFDARKIGVKDKIAGLTIEEISDFRERPGSEQEYSVRVRFSGEVTISGKYIYSQADDSTAPNTQPNPIVFFPDDASVAKLPRLETDSRTPSFALLDVEKLRVLGWPGDIGKATITIKDYCINFFPSCEGVNSAKLVSVVLCEIDEDSYEAGRRAFSGGSVGGAYYVTEPYRSYSLRQEAAVCPDGNSFLVTVKNDDGVHVWALTLSEHWRYPTVFFSAQKDWANGRNILIPLGWRTDETCLFVVGYDQIDGPHAGERGVSIRQGALGKHNAEEAGFIPLENGILHSAWFRNGSGKAYFHASEVIWEYDVESHALKVLKQDLPPDDSPLVNPLFSPSGEFLAYGSYEDNRDADSLYEPGVYLFDLKTGDETAILPVADTFSFYPKWSPDGIWISAYTASRNGAFPSLHSWIYDYGIYPGTDGPAGVARNLTVRNVKTGKTWTAEVEGKIIFAATWSVDSEKVYFMTGDAGPVGASGPRMKYDGLHFLDVNNGTVDRVADFSVLSELISESQGPLQHIYPVGGTKDCFILNVMAGGHEFHDSVWCAGKDIPLSKMCDGEWMVPFGVANCGGTMAGFIKQDHGYSFWRVGSDGPEQLSRSVSLGRPFTRMELLGWSRITRFGSGEASTGDEFRFYSVCGISSDYNTGTSQIIW